MVHAFRLITATGWEEEASRLWAAVYLPAIARTHDGLCDRHGSDEMTRFETLSDVRLGDLDPRYLRNREAHDMVAFAESLFTETDGTIPVGQGHFSALWSKVTLVLGEVDPS